MTDKEKLEKLKKLADAMYYAAQNLTTDASRLHKAMDEYHKFIIHKYKEEPVSEDLEDAAYNWVMDNYGNPKISSFVFEQRCFRAGAKWQKEQMMKDAIERVVKVDAGGYPYIDGTIELYDYSEDKPLAKAGDKVKIIVVKED